ncbi:MAG: hypothetical protein ACXWC4_09005 [Telluria sp.]
MAKDHLDDAIAPAAPHGPVAAREARAPLRHRQHRGHRHPGATPAPAPAPPGPPLPTAPAVIAAPWVGIDKSQIPQTRGRHPQPDTGWMGTLIDNSNLRFTGAYVTGAALPGTSAPANGRRGRRRRASTASPFTNSSLDVKRGWMPSMATLAGQGWGAAFFYVGYSVTGGERMPATGVDAARGTLHGLHLRTTLHALGPEFAGAVVFIDNEDSTSQALPQNLVDYYNALFAEMSRPDPDLGAFRPAMYGHGQPLKSMLAARNDLFLWDVWLETPTTNTPDAPFDASADPITVEPAQRPLKAYVVAPGGGQPFITWPVGRQFRFYTGELPQQDSATAQRLRRWRRVQTWDFDSSFVRNPAFPEAEPRVSVLAHGGRALVAARTFVPRGSGAAASAPAAQLAMLAPQASTLLAAAPGTSLEPDAPTVMWKQGDEVMLCTVLNDARIGVASLAADGTWAAIAAIGGSVPALRRIRALAVASPAPGESMLFLAGADHRLYLKRRGAGPAWEDAAALSDDLRLHPFSRLAAAARGADNAAAFFIDQAGLLACASWARASPGVGIQRLETAPSLLPGGALAAVSPRLDDVLVFGVGSDLRLRFASFISGIGWSTPAPAGRDTDLVGAHTRLAAIAIDESHVELAALTDAGKAVIYPFVRNGSAWVAQNRIVIEDPPALTGARARRRRPQAGTGLQAADGFRLNLFGDLALFRAPGAQACVLYCAGLRSGEAKVLVRDLAAGGSWQYFA